MGYKVWFGKYKGTSIEEIALGKACPVGGGKSEGYYYFYQLGRGDPKYFSYFQNHEFAMQRWLEIRRKLNLFKAPNNCAVCNKNPPTQISIAGSGKYGYSMSGAYVVCDDRNCQIALTSMPSSGTMLYPLGFDTILQFGWKSGNRKGDEQQLTRVLRDVAGWTAGRITEQNATEFIDSLALRI